MASQHKVHFYTQANTYLYEVYTCTMLISALGPFLNCVHPRPPCTVYTPAPHAYPHCIHTCTTYIPSLRTYLYCVHSCTVPTKTLCTHLNSAHTGTVPTPALYTGLLCVHSWPASRMPCVPSCSILGLPSLLALSKMDKVRASPTLELFLVSLW